MKTLFTGAIIICASLFSAQVAPGGYTTALRGWYNASTGYTLVGGAVSTWSDQSGNALHGSQGTAADRPVPNSTGFNYNQSFTFDGLTDMISIPDQMASTATGVTAFVVARQTATNRDNHGTILCGQAAPTGTGGGYGAFSASPSNTLFGVGVDNYVTNAVYNVTSLIEPALITTNFNGTSAGNVQYFFNGTSQGTNGYAGQVGDNGPSFIGSALSAASSSYCFYGDIAEVIVYSVGINAANTTKIESYLALKYGITKTGNYTNSSGSTIYTVSAPYNNEIIGIGRDDNTNLFQKQSKVYDDSVRVFLGTLAATNSLNVSTFASNNQFLVLGSNTDRLSGKMTEKPSGIDSRIQREWKVTNTGFSGNWNFSIKLNSIAVPGSVNQAHLRLLVDDDGDFSNATSYNLSFSYSNPLITVTGISTTQVPLNSTRYITIGSSNVNTPLPIELFSFESIICSDEVCLKWSTATEKNNEVFKVERSANGEDWEIVGSVPGAINSSTQKDYQFTDTKPLKELSYYRLLQIDNTGEFSYSNITSVQFRAPQEFTLFPNPANNEVTISGNPKEYKLIDAFGRDLTNQITGTFLPNGTLTLDLHSLISGIYYLQVIDHASPAQAFKLVVRH